MLDKHDPGRAEQLSKSREKYLATTHGHFLRSVHCYVNATHHKTDRGIHDKKIINASLPKNFSSLMNDLLFLSHSEFAGFRVLEL